MNRRKANALARKIAVHLFTSGAGEVAERLLLWKDSTNQDLGGWGLAAIQHTLADIIAGATFDQSMTASEMGSKGGRATAATMAPEQRKARAKAAAAARWGKKR